MICATPLSFFVAVKGGFAADIEFLCGIEFACRLGAFALRCHFALKAFGIKFDAEFARHVGGEIVGEAVGVVEFEDNFAGDNQFAVGEVFFEVGFQCGDVGRVFRIWLLAVVMLEDVLQVNNFRLFTGGAEDDLFASGGRQGVGAEGFAVGGMQFERLAAAVQRQQ